MLLFAWPLLWITAIKILLDSSLLCSVGHPVPDIVETHSSLYPSHGQSFRSLPNTGETTTVATVNVSNILTKTSLTTELTKKKKKTSPWHLNRPPMEPTWIQSVKLILLITVTLCCLLYLVSMLAAPNAYTYQIGSFQRHISQND